MARHAQGCERLFHVCYEASRPAEVDIRLSWDADLFEDRSRQVSGSVETLTHLVARARPAVTNEAAAVREREHEAANFGGEIFSSEEFAIQPRSSPRIVWRTSSRESGR